MLTPEQHLQVFERYSETARNTGNTAAGLIYAVLAVGHAILASRLVEPKMQVNVKAPTR
jgi:hypothetical protein